ncbi:MAG: trypsin-like peptidase domain-containing protein [Hyphomicrobiales bacterium]|nr:trypsin-like peptidase domain-containing protein [Hyphomicrobiales bacterium]MBV8823360.1 trypsin-like peptidase domain-containing protein [Hyphomicrobiales bacterium]MBV9429568.1 trypsin-like peptidase domain-containing protein [Bradyrhizobiaceae bacterium]
MSGSTNLSGSASPSNLSAHYRRLLAGQPGGGALESTAFEAARPSEPDLSSGAISERVAVTRAELNRIVKEYLGDKPDLYEVADQIARGGETALHAVADEDHAKLAQDHVLNALEVIVRTDGSRPSFMVKNDEADRATSPVGNWGATLNDSAQLLRQALRCIGRVDDPSGAQGFQGTAIRIGQNLVMTNRHVLQVIGSEQPDRSWRLKPNIAVDFVHEYRSRDSVDRRNVNSVLFCGTKPIDRQLIDHAKLDLVLLDIEPGSENQGEALALDISPDWGQRETGVFICGYPGNPGPFAEAPSLLERLFRSTFGFKRLAPGLVTTEATVMAASPRKWTLGHDATTLGGNSGSAVLVIGRDNVAAGIHYGGRRSDPRENWCHVFGLALDEPDSRSGKSLREMLQSRNVQFVDR